LNDYVGSFRIFVEYIDQKLCNSLYELQFLLFGYILVSNLNVYVWHIRLLIIELVLEQSSLERVRHHRSQVTI